MTALPEFARLETVGLWADAPDAQRKEVVVSFGDASLVLSDKNEVPIAHWSLAALNVVSRKKGKVIYSPSIDTEESLEITDDLMNEAIAKVRKDLRKGRPNPGRLRLMSGLGIITILAALLIFWFPQAIANYASNITPEAKASELGWRMLDATTKVTGPACKSPYAQGALNQLAERFSADPQTRLHIIDLGEVASLQLPGHNIVLHRRLIENMNGPEALAGHILLQQAVTEIDPPLYSLFRYSGVIKTVNFLRTGEVQKAELDAFAQHLLSTKRPIPELNKLSELFQSSKLQPKPFARTYPPLQKHLLKISVPTGEPVLSDDEWAALEIICIN